MITLKPTSLTHVYVEFKDETVRGVTYSGSYHAQTYDNGKTWEGYRESAHADIKPFDYPLNTHRALSARRQNANSGFGSNEGVSGPAKAALATRCLSAVLEALKSRPQEFVQAQAQALLEAQRRKLDALKEAEAALSKARREEREAWEAFDAYRTNAGLPSEDRKQAS